MDTIIYNEKNIILKSDGTWEYLKKNKKNDLNDFGMWKFNNYTDDFGEDILDRGFISYSGKINFHEFGGKDELKKRTLAGINITNHNIKLSIWSLDEYFNRGVFPDLSPSPLKARVRHNGKKIEPDFIFEYKIEEHPILGSDGTWYTLTLKYGNQYRDLFNVLKLGGKLEFKLLGGPFGSERYNIKTCIFEDTSGFLNIYNKNKHLLN